jgi:hypothetical protein
MIVAGHRRTSQLLRFSAEPSMSRDDPQSRLGTRVLRGRRLIEKPARPRTEVLDRHGARRSSGYARSLRANYESIYWLCYIRGPEGILIGLAQQLGQQSTRKNLMKRQDEN